MKLKLNLADRLSLETYLPEETGLKDLIIKKDILSKTRVTQDDVLKYDIKDDGKNTFWNKEGSEAEFEIEFTELEIILLRSSFRNIAEQNKLRMHHLNLAQQLINE